MATEREQYIIDLQKQLGKVLAGGDFANSEGGKLIMDMLTTDVNNFTKQILSDAFIKDHDGYLDARAKANYAASLLGRLVSANNPDAEKGLREQIKAASNDNPDDSDA